MAAAPPSVSPVGAIDHRCLGGPQGPAAGAAAAVGRLSPGLRGQLRSGVAVSSLARGVEELVLNSLDAGATCVGVRVDAGALSVRVADNGAGVERGDLEALGDRYHTSKWDRGPRGAHGFRGEALASLAAMAALVEVSSRAGSSPRTYVKVFKGGVGLGVAEAERPRPSAGTTVAVRGLFCNLPVRRRRVDPALEGDRVRRAVEAAALVHPSVSFTLRDDCSAAMLVQLPKAADTRHRFAQIHGPQRAQALGDVRLTRGPFEVDGHIGREGHYNGGLQFLYVNERLLLKTRLHKLLNFLLRKPSQKSEGPDQAAAGSPRHRRNQELHGVYVINIKCPVSEYDVCLDPAKTLIEFKDWDGVLACVEEAVKAFLRRENLNEASQDEGCSTSEMADARTTDVEAHASGPGQQAVGSVSKMEYSIGTKLSSHSVHRKSKSLGSFCTDSALMPCEERFEKEDIADQSESVMSNKNTTEECGKETRGDPAKLEPVCDRSSPGENGDTFSHTEEHISETTSEEERHISPSNAASLSEVETINDCNRIDPMLSDHQGAGQHSPPVESNRKIGLSDPYIHECLQAPDPSQINGSAQQQQTQPPTCEDEALALKRKISLQPDNERSRHKLAEDLAPAVPPKKPRTSTCPRVSLRRELGSLEQFRRVYGKSENLKPASQEMSQRTHTKVPLSHAAGKSSTGLAAPVQEGGKRSLASKLRHMKQHGSQKPRVLERSSRRDAFQDSNNNRKHCIAAAHPEPEPGRSADTQPCENEDSAAAGDWLRHYDASLGKMVYVNKVTGLSRYKDRPLEGTEVQCRSDITTMAVNVLSEMGREYKCYPFQTDLVLPFVPKSRSERVISVGLDNNEADGSGSNSLTTLYSEWNNPVFVRPPTVGLDISCQQADGLAVKIHNVLYPYRFSKDMIHSMKVIQQVDKKFLACLISTKDGDPTDLPDSEGNLLVLVDQHAAHERVRLENLIADSYEDDPATPGERRLCSSSILPPLEIGVTEEELRLFRSCQSHLRSLGLEVKFSEAAEPQILVGKVPVCFTEKESNELRRGRPSVIRPIVEEYLQEQLELLRSTGRVRGTLPLTVLKVLASLACHGAIKFNDSLSKDECHSLVASLSSCQLPFQCAHGRPSIAPLVDVLHLDKDQKETQKPNLGKLRRMYKAWQLYG